jgi:hypothetical protein
MSTGSDKPKRRPRRGKRWPLDEALRRQGLDETGYARKLGGFFDQVEGNAKVAELKLMLDGLKELSRHLEPKRFGAAGANEEPPTVVQLVHSVDRPSRSDISEPCELASDPDPT